MKQYLIITILLLSACQEQQKTATFQTYVYSDQNNKFQMAEIEQEETTDVLFDKWQHTNQYYIPSNSVSDEKEEKDRILQYCKDYGFNSCRKITYTCGEEGGGTVKVECIDSSYNPKFDDPDDCKKFKVTSSETTEECES